MSSVDRVLDRLDGVKQTGTGRFLARCPAHDDKTPSLSIREADDGMVLVRCWAGCTFDEIVGAAGLQPSDLFPPKPPPAGTHHTRGYRKPFPAADVLAALAHEATYVAVTARDIVNGESLTGDDVHRLMTAAGRLMEGASHVNA